MAGVVEAPAGASASGARRGRSPRFANVSFAVNPSHVRSLLWLRWRITLRGYTRSWQRVVSLVFGLIFVLLIGGGLAVGSGAAYTALPRDAAVQILFVVLAGLYLAWAVLPLLQYNLNEGLDVTKLQAYPVTRGEQMVSLVIATLLDISTLFILFLFLAIAATWHATFAALVVTILALVLAYVHIVGFSQLILAALMGLMRSRRYRDLTVIVFALLGSSCWLIEQFVVARVGPALAVTDPSALANLRVDRFLQWTPPGAAARAIALADQGEYGLAILWLLGLAALVPVLLILWARVLDHSIVTAETATASSGRRGSRRRGRADVPAAAAASVRVATLPAAHGASWPRRGVLSGAARAIAVKDLLYLWRDPQLKAALLSSIAPMLLVFLPNLYSGRSVRYAHGYSAFGSSFNLAGPQGVLIAPLPALLIVTVLALNAFGLERQGLQTLFLFPIRPLDVFWGKNIAAGAVAFAAQIVLTVVKAAITGGWSYVPLALIGGLAALLVLLGLGNATSVLFPFRTRQMRMGDNSSYSSEAGCLRSVISLSTLLLGAILLIPVAGAIIIPLVFLQPAWFTFTLPFAIVYGLLLHQVPTRIVAPMLIRRAPEILAVAVRET